MASFKRLFRCTQLMWCRRAQRRQFRREALSRPSQFRLEPLEPRLLLSGAVNLWSGEIPNGTVWQAGDVQRITGDVRVPQGATLTVHPGTIVQFNPFAGIDLAIDGTLDARGTAVSPILFTSVRDDTGFDGILGTTDDIDTEGNGPSNAGNGDWNSIQFSAISAGNVLDHVEVRYGGAGSLGSQVVVESSQLSLTDSVIRNSSTAGLRINASTPTLTNNTFQGSFGAAISMDLASNPAIRGVTVTSNGVNGLALDSGTLPGNGFWDDPDIVYRLSGDVTVPEGKTLTIAPGQIIKARTFAGDDLIVNGTLLSDGTSAQPIIFTSDRDDSAGGDINNNGATTGNNGDWNSIQFTSTSTGNVLDHVEVRFGGSGSFGAVVATGGRLVLTNSIFRNSSIHAFIARSNASVIYRKESPPVCFELFSMAARALTVTS